MAVCGGQENSTAKKSGQKFSFLYLHSIQLAIPKTKIISLCFISLVALGFAVNLSAARKREGREMQEHHENLERCRQVQNSITVKKFNPGKSFVICISDRERKLSGKFFFFLMRHSKTPTTMMIE